MAATKAKRAKSWRVLNPRGIPDGIPILTCVTDCGVEFFEGDTLVLSDHAHLNPDRLIAQGFIEAVTRG